MWVGFFLLFFISMDLRGIRSFKAHLNDQWYLHDPDLLKKQLAAYEKDGGIKVDPYQGAKALIVPHAGYKYSGSVAAAGYRLLNKKKIKRVIVLAPSHAVAMQGVALPFFDRYVTPLGALSIDNSCVDRLAQNDLYKKRQDVWSKEHAIEVQLPFIQYYLGNVSLVPLIIGDNTMHQMRLIADTLSLCIDEETIVIISSDFIHHGMRFGYTPFLHTHNVQQRIKELDEHIFHTIMYGTAYDLLSLLNKTRATVCGKMPLLLFKLLQEKKVWSSLSAELVMYATSYAITHDPINSVSYAALIFKKNKELR